MIPIGLAILFVTGVGPLLAWRRASIGSLKRAFLVPASIAVVGGALLFGLGIRHPYALTAMSLAVFVALSIIQEFWKGTMARRSSNGEGFFEALTNLTMRNTRRYGGYLVHFGMVLLFVGFSGQAFNVEENAEMDLGETVQVRQYTIRLDDIRGERTPNYDSSEATISLFEDGVLVARMFPERRFYPASEQSTSEVSFRSNLREDLYINFAGTVERLDGTGLLAVVQIFLNPLVMWVWIGGIVVALGTLVALLPNKKAGPTRQSPQSREDKTDTDETNQENIQDDQEVHA
jgi:cytochrome c-type biogenesis protein CcmF